MDFSECRCLKIFIKQNSRNSGGMKMFPPYEEAIK